MLLPALNINAIHNVRIHHFICDAHQLRVQWGHSSGRVHHDVPYHLTFARILWTQILMSENDVKW